MFKEEFPDPNSVRYCKINSVKYINDYEGVSNVTINCPDMNVPLLPFKSEDKLIFPTGTFTGWYSHIELRKAMELGYVVMKVHETVYYKKTCTPFKEYVHDLYSLRQKFKSEGSSMEVICKLFMNSLYGKFGQKFEDREVWKTEKSFDFSSIKEGDEVETIGGFVRVKVKFQDPALFCIPIWAIYVSAYGRLKLYEELRKRNVIYCDTDSIVTHDVIPDSSELGKLKLELVVHDAVFVKPKMYFINENVKIKGVGRKIVVDDFFKLLATGQISYEKFVKFKESLRRDLVVNEILSVNKVLDLEDSKRDWFGLKFNAEELQHSRPLRIELNEHNELFEHVENELFIVQK
jgi:hypothetical protein